MQPLVPFFREVGSGPGVVCLHANSSSSAQWRALTELIGGKFHVLAADSYGSGKSPPWPAERPLRLRDEVELLEPVFARAGEPFALVAHSYGAAAALVAAVTRPGRIRALAVYEPVLLSLLDEESPPSSLGVARLLTGALPGAEVVRFEGLGHMGPVTHPEVVNEAIRSFLERTAGSGGG